MSTEHGYNGWSNYETWAVKLWLDNDEGQTQYWRERAECAWDEAAEDEPLFSWDDRASRAARTLARELKDAHEEFADTLGLFDGERCGFVSDLFSSALSEVDWHEIANSLLGAVVADSPKG